MEKSCINEFYWRSGWNFQCLNLICEGNTKNDKKNCCSVLSEPPQPPPSRHLWGFRRKSLQHQSAEEQSLRKSWIHSTSHTLDPLLLVFYPPSSLFLALLHTCLFCLELKWAQVQSLQTNKFPTFQGKCVFFCLSFKRKVVFPSEITLSVMCRAMLCLLKVQCSQLQKHVEKRYF